MRANIMGEAGDILFDDLEGLLREINDYCVAGKPEEIPHSLEGYLNYVAKTGNTVFPWQHVRLLFRNKIMQAMEQFPGETCPNNETFLMERFDLFRSAPFTIQRLAELITQPTRHYKKKSKFLNGLEKTVLVVSTVEPWSVDNDYRNGNESNASDGEMDQTYSESDDSGISNNRTFNMEQTESLAISEGLQGQGDGIGVNISLSSSEIGIENVTTTMVNITSNGSQSTSEKMNTSCERLEEIEWAVENVPVDPCTINQDNFPSTATAAASTEIENTAEIPSLSTLVEKDDKMIEMVENETYGISEGLQGDGIGVNISLSSEIEIENVTTTMINITSDGSQSTSEKMNTSCERLEEIEWAVENVPVDPCTTNEENFPSTTAKAAASTEIENISEIPTRSTLIEKDNQMIERVENETYGISEGLQGQTNEIGVNKSLSSSEIDVATTIINITSDDNSQSTSEKINTSCERLEEIEWAVKNVPVDPCTTNEENFPSTAAAAVSTEIESNTAEIPTPSTSVEKEDKMVENDGISEGLQLQGDEIGVNDSLSSSEIDVTTTMINITSDGS